MATGNGKKKFRGVAKQTPTHRGTLYRNGSLGGAKLVVKLVETDTHWVTPSSMFFRKSDGLPRGRTTTAVWVLDLSSVVPIEGTSDGGEA